MYLYFVVLCIINEWSYLSFVSIINLYLSAILASVLDTITLVYRQKEKMAALSDVISSLSRGKRSVAAVSTLLPLDVSGWKNCIIYIRNFKEKNWGKMYLNFFQFIDFFYKFRSTNVRERYLHKADPIASFYVWFHWPKSKRQISSTFDIEGTPRFQYLLKKVRRCSERHYDYTYFIIFFNPYYI